MKPGSRIHGRLEVICGPMFAGKTTQLISRLAHHAGLGLRVVAFKPASDLRYAPRELVTHDGVRLAAVGIDSPALILGAARGHDVVGIDEAHFFGAGLVAPCRELIRRGVLVIVAGVERNHRGEPFDPFPALLCEADEVVKQSGPCALCGRPAVHSQRLFASDDAVVVGGADTYQARCRACFEGGPPLTPEGVAPLSPP